MIRQLFKGVCCTNRSVTLTLVFSKNRNNGPLEFGNLSCNLTHTNHTRSLSQPLGAVDHYFPFRSLTTPSPSPPSPYFCLSSFSPLLFHHKPWGGPFPLNPVRSLRCAVSPQQVSGQCQSRLAKCILMCLDPETEHFQTWSWTNCDKRNLISVDMFANVSVITTITNRPTGT